MLLMEDFDSVYNGRLPCTPNIQLGTPPSFDSLLNQIQGVGSNDGLMVFLTTNHLKSIDQALGGHLVDGHAVEHARPRPGRVDMMIQTPDSISEEGRIVIATRMLPKEHWGDLIQSTAGMTPAQYHEAVLQRAINIEPPETT
jgi:SpoVK/Ycf46/Vps4 family AAA+-type ATPase